MSSIVSVIIVCNEEPYLQRCKNSIERQTYKNREIFVINEENGYENLDGVIDIAKGEYLFFMNSTASVSKNTLERLVDIAEKDKNTLACTTVYKKSGNNFETIEGQLGLWGKLFNKEIVQEVGLPKIPSHKFSECEFVAKYLSKVKKCVRDLVSGLYETATEVLDETVEKSYINDLCRGLLSAAENVKKIPIEQDDKTFTVSYDVFQDEEGKNQVFITKTEWPFPSEEEIEKKAQSVLQEKMAANIEELMVAKKELSFLREKCGQVSSNISDKEAFAEPQGYMLSEYVIGKFANGNLGIKTIFKAFSAWVKYKLGRK